MKFALFYEIPVARPWDERSEYRAYHHTLEQAVLGDRLGFHSIWTVEHHFLEEFSHCSNPEVLYGAIAARTQNIRIGPSLPAFVTPNVLNVLVEKFNIKPVTTVEADLKAALSAA